MSISIGPITTRNRVFLAPMSGVSDLPFRALASEYGAGLVVSEMVASADLARQQPEMMRRSQGGNAISPLVIQLAGREDYWMAKGAELAAQAGAALIDINMGCPARAVTGGMSGAALMRDPVHAAKLIAATIAASPVPVSLKMRLGWDDDNINAPELALRAQDLGIAMISVHGRTRCQFYNGAADWAAVRKVRDKVQVPLIVNGDCHSIIDAKTMLAQSGADGVMIGRASYGKPWLPGVIAEGLDPGCGILRPKLPERMKIIRQHYAEILAFYGEFHGVKIARKHLGWYLTTEYELGHLDGDELKSWKQKLMALNEPVAVCDALDRLAGYLLRRLAQVA